MTIPTQLGSEASKQHGPPSVARAGRASKKEDIDDPPRKSGDPVRMAETWFEVRIFVVGYHLIGERLHYFIMKWSLGDLDEAVDLQLVYFRSLGWSASTEMPKTELVNRKSTT